MAIKERKVPLKKGLEKSSEREIEKKTSVISKTVISKDK